MQSDPKCEVCGKEPATSFSYFDGGFEDEPEKGWKFTGDCTTDKEAYWILISQYPAAPWMKNRSWLGHLREKRWFIESDFLAMLKRFEEAKQPSLQ